MLSFLGVSIYGHKDFFKDFYVPNNDTLSTYKKSLKERFPIKMTTPNCPASWKFPSLGDTLLVKEIKEVKDSEEYRSLEKEFDHYPCPEEFSEAKPGTQIITLLEIYNFVRHKLLDHDTDDHYFEELELDVNTKMLLFLLNVVPVSSLETYNFQTLYSDIHECIHDIIYFVIKKL